VNTYRFHDVGMLVQHSNQVKVPTTPTPRKRGGL
jgi:hypothetical protein